MNGSSSRGAAVGGDLTMTMMDHLRELRMRIVRALMGVAIGMVVVLSFYDPILQFLTEPYRDLCATNPDYSCDGSLFALGPLDGFAARIRIATWGGVILALPIVFWQIWRFIAPGLDRREKRYAVPFIASTTILFAIGCWMAYWTLDKALEFLISWSGSSVDQAYQVSKYVSLVTLMALAFGAGFLSPVLILFLQLVGIVTPRTLIRQWRIAIMCIFVAAAVITPSGDPVSLMALSIPMTLLYFLAVFIGWLITRRRTR